MANIFKYANNSDPNIYSDIRSYQNFDTNIFGYSFVSKNFIRIYSDICSCHFLDTNIFGYSFVSKSIRMSHSVPFASAKFIDKTGKLKQKLKLRTQIVLDMKMRLLLPPHINDQDISNILFISIHIEIFF